MVQEIPRLPGYPSTQDCKALSPLQVASVNQNISAAISIILALPADTGKRDTLAIRNFLTTYAKDTAFQTLQNLIWQDSSNQTPSRSTGNRKLIHQRSLLLAEKFASSSNEIGIELLLDLAIIYVRLRFSQIQSVFLAAFKSNPTALTETVSADLVPGLTTLLSREGTSASQGLYAMRKVAECIFAFLRASGGSKGVSEFVRPFAYSKPFTLALASFYDSGLTTIASTYGGLSAITIGMSNQGREPDEWETIWVETKVALLDAFHIIITTLLDDLASCPAGPRLAFEAERTFEMIFALLQIPSSSTTIITTDIPPTPFLNRPLLADYQESYSLSKTLAKALHHAQEKDARLDILENSLQAFHAEVENHNSDRAEERNPGALKILLRSSGVQCGIDNRGTRNRPAAAPTASTAAATLSTPNKFALNSSSNQTIPKLDRKGKGRAKERPSDPSNDIDLDLKTIQVLDILPDLSSTYIRLLLTHDRYDGDAEKVVAALLEGTALSEEGLGSENGKEYASGDVVDAQDGKQYSLNQRRNVFDEEVLDVNLFRTGKKTIGLVLL
jgi:activating signal cointegrator complex subunit 2